MPTVSAITGIPLPADKKTDGYNLLPVLKGETMNSPRDDIYYYNGRKLEAYRQGDWKIHLPRKANTKNTYSNDVDHNNGGDVIWWAHAARGGSHHNLDRNLLNNVRQDQKEQVDLSTSHPEITQRLLKKVETIRAELGDHGLIGSDGPR